MSKVMKCQFRGHKKKYDTSYQKQSFRGTLNNGKLTGISIMYTKRTILKLTLNLLFIAVYGKYNFNPSNIFIRLFVYIYIYI